MVLVHYSVKMVIKNKKPRAHDILTEGDVRPHKVNYYLKQRDSRFEEKRINALRVYKAVGSTNLLMIPVKWTQLPYYRMRNQVFKLLSIWLPNSRRYLKSNP